MMNTMIFITEKEIEEVEKMLKNEVDKLERWAKNVLSDKNSQERGKVQVVNLFAHLAAGLTPPGLAPEGLAVLVLAATGRINLPPGFKSVREKGRIRAISTKNGKTASFRIPLQVKTEAKKK